MEGHVGVVELRAQMEPVWGASISSSQDHYFAFQHAVEVQFGHLIGGGLRYQGVLVATNNPELVQLPEASGTSSGNTPGTDHYQGLLEPFFKLYHDPIFLRVGLLIPIAAPLGPPFIQAWGTRGTLGWSLD